MEKSVFLKKIATKNGTFPKIVFNDITKDVYIINSDLSKVYLTGNSGSIDLSNYYTKSEVDDIINALVFLTQSDLNDFYTKSEVDTLLTNINVDVDLTNYYTKSEVDNELGNKADITELANKVNIDDVYIKGEVYNKPEIDTLLTNINVDVDLTNYYTKSEVDNELDNKADITELDAKANIDDVYIKGEVYNKDEVYNKPEIDTLLTNINVDVDLTNYYTKDELYNIDEIDALIDGVNNNLVLDNYFTKNETNDLLNTKVDKVEGSFLMTTSERVKLNAIEEGAQKNVELKTLNGVALVGSGNITTLTQADIDGKADIVHTHSVNDINETSTRSFISNSEKTQITSNANDIGLLTERVIDLESATQTTSTDELVKMDVNGSSKYLGEMIDDTTIRNVGGFLTAVSLNGLDVTTFELNQLAGVSSNIQEQIDALTSVGNFTTTVDTYAELATLTPNANDMVIVLEDEMQMDPAASIYIYNGIDWVFSGTFKGGEVRNFTTNPLALETETTGILSKSKYEKQTAAETTILDANNVFTATNVEDALTELFTYANNIKSKVATVIGSPLSSNDTVTQLVDKIQEIKIGLAEVISNKGVITQPFNSFGEMTNKIALIPTVSVDGALKRIEKRSYNVNDKIEIVLSEPLMKSDIVATLFEYIPGVANQTVYSNDFETANGYTGTDIDFNGVMEIKKNHDVILTETSNVDGVITYTSQPISNVNNNIISISFN